MSRTVRDARLETRAARERLSASRKPRYRTLIPGQLHLGYRKRRAGAPGLWTVRQYVGQDAAGAGRYREATLGRADDYEEADGDVVLTYAQAQARALNRPGEVRGPLTVADAAAAYLAARRANRQPTGDAESRYRLHIAGPLGDRLVEELTTEQLEAWLADIASTPSRGRGRNGSQRLLAPPTTDDRVRARHASANRTLTTLKAILNHAFRRGMVASDAAWGRRLRPFREIHVGSRRMRVDVKRERALTLDEAQRLLAACPPDFALLVRAALETGARYGELCRLVVGDFDARARTVHVRLSKSGRDRRVFLTPEGARFFGELCRGRAADDVMLRRADGGVWDKSDQIRPMARAIEHAGIAPASFHTLRHSYASMCVEGGIPLTVIAKNLGHRDTKMLEHVYAHLQDQHMRAAIAAGAPRFLGR